MVAPRRLLRALIGASAVLGAVLVVAPAPAHAHPRDPRPPNTAPLHLSIDDFAPSYLPRKGTIEIHGQVTNVSDQTWTTLKLYSFFGDTDPAAPVTPMTNAAQLARAAALPYDAYAGDRILEGTPGSIDTLKPGQTAPYDVEVPASALHASRGGVYWFGVQALATSESGTRDNEADGRVRTFLPYLPKRVHGQLPTALVLPLVRSIPFAEDGSLDMLPQWTRSLSPDGRVRDVVDFAGGAGEVPLTWLVDPALVDAVGRLARNNPPRSLAPDDRGSGAPTPTATATPLDPATTGAADDPTAQNGSVAPPDEETATAARVAGTWLEELKQNTEGKQVLALPYGDLDTAAALHEDPSLLEKATSAQSTELARLGIDTAAALSSPSGYLDQATIGNADPDTTVLGSDRMFAAPAPGVASVAGHRVVVSSSGAAAGGPGPGPALTAVSLRQRILSEAAVRLIKADAQPLVVTLPTEWALDDADAFFSGLDVPWLHLESLTAVDSGTGATAISPDDLVYPARQLRRELDPQTFADVDSLMKSGSTLQSLLTRNTAVSGEVTRQALSGASYAVRGHQLSSRAALNRSREWVDSKLAGVQISAPPGVTLSSASGQFAATITNRLDEPVTVGVRARGAGIEFTQPKTVDLGPHSHTTVLLEARSSSNKVSNVTLTLVDQGGTPLGGSDRLPIRSAQVSKVIWLIMGTGVVLLFGAIAVRLFRRITRARARRRAPALR